MDRARVADGKPGAIDDSGRSRVAVLELDLDHDREIEKAIPEQLSSPAKIRALSWQQTGKSARLRTDENCSCAVLTAEKFPRGEIEHRFLGTIVHPDVYSHTAARVIDEALRRKIRPSVVRPSRARTPDHRHHQHDR
jgi:hypothetical protein